MRFLFFSLLFASITIFADVNDISKTLEAIRVKNKLPAIAAAVVKNDAVVAIGATGFRKHGSNIRVNVFDKFHIGSCTKSMTATLAAMMVEQKKISWNTTLIEVFPQLQIHPTYQNVTLEQLLGNRGGMPANPSLEQIKLILKKKTIARQREALVEQITKNSVAQAPGTYVYSNCSFITAGRMLEKKLQSSWETLLQKHLFKILQMNTAGFGPPDSGKLKHPWCHFYEKNKQIIPISPNAKYEIPMKPGVKYPADNPAFYGPAGTVHCSIGNLATYIVFYLQGRKGLVKHLSKTSFAKLHTAPPGHFYALGWVKNKNGIIWHNGSNGNNFALMHLDPQNDIAVVVATNIGGKPGKNGCDEVVSVLLKKFSQKH